MAIHSSILAWKIPWTEEPGKLQPMRSQGVGCDSATKQCLGYWMRRSLRPHMFWVKKGTVLNTDVSMNSEFKQQHKYAFSAAFICFLFSLQFANNCSEISLKLCCLLIYTHFSHPSICINANETHHLDLPSVRHSFVSVLYFLHFLPIKVASFILSGYNTRQLLKIQTRSYLRMKHFHFFSLTPRVLSPFPYFSLSLFHSLIILALSSHSIYSSVYM